MEEYKIANKGKNRIYFVMFTLVMISALVSLYFSQPSVEIICPSRKLFGIFCSACGITRAAYNLLHLNFAAAFNFNQFFVVSLPLYLYIYVAIAAKVFLNAKIYPRRKTIIIFFIIYFSLFLLYGIMRNFEVFAFLSPR
jgi:hypothetical protein